MLLCDWSKLPKEMRTREVLHYYKIIRKHTAYLIIKRAFDVVVSFLALLILSPFFAILAILIKIDSPGPVFYRQVRVTQFGRKFRIHKFRSMCEGADKKGPLVSIQNDMRITNVGKVIRKLRLDEVSQLIDILLGRMTFVGTRPEVPRYVDRYTPEMYATLLLPAGLTNHTSLYFSDEAAVIGNAENADDIYVEKLLPEKMFYNYYDLEQCSIINDAKILIKTVFVIFGATYSKDMKYMVDEDRDILSLEDPYAEDTKG